MAEYAQPVGTVHPVALPVKVPLVMSSEPSVEDNIKLLSVLSQNRF